MNIHEYASKIKVLTQKEGFSRPSHKKEVFLALCVIFVATASFGLGRLSNQKETLTPVSISDDVSIDKTREGSLPTALDNSKVIPESVLIADRITKKYTFTWCQESALIAQEDKLSFATILLATKAGFTQETHCTKTE